MIAGKIYGDRGTATHDSRAHNCMMANRSQRRFAGLLGVNCEVPWLQPQKAYGKNVP